MFATYASRSFRTQGDTEGCLIPASRLATPLCKPITSPVPVLPVARPLLPSLKIHQKRFSPPASEANTCQNN